MCVVGDVLKVFDTDSHQVRCVVDLICRIVNMVVGTGVKGTANIGAKQSVKQEISSPWEICHVEGRVCVVAMAGLH